MRINDGEGGDLFPTPLGLEVESTSSEYDNEDPESTTLSPELRYTVEGPRRRSHRRRFTHIYNNSLRLITDADNLQHNEQQDGDTLELERDIFSLIFICPIFSKAFGFSFFIFSLQMLILMMAMINLLGGSTKGNPLNVPPFNKTEEIFAQAFALTGALLTNDDMTSFLALFQIDYNSSIKSNLPSATRSKWIISNSLRCGEGVLGLVVSFIFIVASNGVLDIFQNFTAIQFVSELDNIGFYLAERGFVSMGVRRYTILSNAIRMKYSTPFRAGRQSFLVKLSKITATCLPVLVAATIYGAWADIKSQQMRGYFYQTECQQFNVRFEDVTYDYFDLYCKRDTVLGEPERECPPLWTSRIDPIRYQSFSDTYYAAVDLETGGLKLQNNRPIYFQRGDERRDFRSEEKNNPGPPGMISYCQNMNAWVFSIKGVRKGAYADDCSWLLKSPKTDSLFLHDVPEGDWEVWSGIVSETVVDITCTECGERIQEKVDCGFNGQCIDKQCVCEGKWMGKQCDTCTSCKTLDFVENGDPGSIFLNSTLTNYMVRLDKNGIPFDVYGRPVYYHGIQQSDAPNIVSQPLVVMLYTGGDYWIWELSPGSLEGEENEENLIKYLESFHSTWDYQEDKKPWFIARAIHDPLPTRVTWSNYTSGEDVDIDLQCRNLTEAKSCDHFFGRVGSSSDFDTLGIFF
jgi:hypothetical protein